jgi:hypothetical protein
VTDDDPHAWCGKNDFNIIVTHHPTSWLDHNSLAYWISDINPSGRFDVHLFGHLHEPKTESISAAGSRPKTSIQAASMFGLAYTKEGIERSHGYSVARLSIQPHQMEVRFWPRKLHKLDNGERKLGPDVKFDLAPDNSATILLRSLSETSAFAERQPSERTTLGSIAEQSREVLQKIRYQITSAPAHTNVRKIEQRRLQEMLLDRPAAWVIAEWGMGEDGFLSSIGQLKGHVERPVYRLDLTDFKNRQEFLNEISEILDCSFQQLCELVSQSGDSVLLLDNFSAKRQQTSTAR